MIDMAGLAQKGGAVYSHVRLANDAGRHPRHPRHRRRGRPRARLRPRRDRHEEGAGLGQAGPHGARRQHRRGHARRFHPQRRFLAAGRAHQARDHARRRAASASHFVDATAIATGAPRQCHRGQHVHARLRLPARPRAARRARPSSRRSSSTAKRSKMNLAAFDWGRRAAAEPERRRGLHGRAARRRPSRAHLSQTLDEIIARRIAFLTDYQNAAYARALPRRVERVREAEAQAVAGLDRARPRRWRARCSSSWPTRTSTRSARLYTNGHFEKQVAATFEGDNLRYEFHLAPPLLARKRPDHGRAAQDELRAVDDDGLPRAGEAEGLARHAARPLRLHPRAQDRAPAHRATTRRCSAEIVATLDAGRTTRPRSALAAIPQKIRGFGHIKARNLEAAKREEAELLARFRATVAGAADRGRVALPAPSALQAPPRLRRRSEGGRSPGGRRGRVTLRSTLSHGRVRTRRRVGLLGTQGRRPDRRGSIRQGRRKT